MENVLKKSVRKKITEVQKSYFKVQTYGYSIDDSEFGQIGTITKNAILAYNIHFKGSSDC